MNQPPAIRPRLPLASPRPLPGGGNMLRRLSLGLVSTSLLGSWTTPSLWALQSVVVHGDNVNVRGRASLAGEVLVQLNQGDLIQMVDKIVAVGAKAGTPSSWAQIQLPPSVPVYVQATFLDGDTVAATKLNIRGGPGENYSVLGSLQRGAKIHSLGNQGGWVRIRPTPETYAFVAADYVVKSPSPAPAARPVVAKVASPPPVAAPIPVTATVPAPRVSPPAAAEVPDETPTSPADPIPPLAVAAPVAAATIAPVVTSTTSSLVTSAAADVPVPAVMTLAQVQPIAPTQPPGNLAARPADSSTTPPSIQEPLARLEAAHDAPRLNHISFGYRFGLNSHVEFKGFALPPQRPPGIFDDGYVLDSSRQTAGPTPAADGRTWNWGYDRPSQVQGDTLLLTHSYLRARTDSHQLEDDLESGFELAYSLELYRGGNYDACHFGLEAAFNYSAVDVQNTWTHSLDIVRDTTTYALGGVVPPYDPLSGQTYQGNYGGPGPTIPVNGTLSQLTIPDGPSMTSYRELVANTYGLRLGPYFESPLYKSLWGTVGTGLAIGLVDSELSYADVVHGLPLAGSASDFSALVGWYIGGGLSYKWSDSWSLFYNAQYQWLPDYSMKAGMTEARFKAGNGIFQSIGIRYSF